MPIKAIILFALVVGTLRVPFPALAADLPNLLVNAGFEELDPRGLPRGWDLFVLPRDGAEGRPDAAAFDGRRSVMLRVSTPYPNEPANNWSQPVFAGFRGKTLRLEGRVKTQDNAEGALWIQCWRKDPAHVIASAVTSTSTSGGDVSEWTLLDTSLVVPELTDFIMVRCVLKGVGAAWFDALSLAEVVGKPEAVKLTEVPENLVERAEKLGQAEDEWRKALQDLRQSNADLLNRIRALQEELATLRNEVMEAVPRPVVEAPAPPELPKPKYGPPLVPRGHSGTTP